MSRYAKAIVAAIGGAATVIVATVPPDNAVTRWAAAVLAVLTAAGVYGTPNTPQRPALVEKTMAPPR